jgi:hypothetical protein
MELPGFNAEASVYATTRHYYAGMATVADDGSVHAAAEEVCPPRCVEICEHGCRADGLPPGTCGALCARDCNAYGDGLPLSCGPCVDNLQTCTVCGGGKVTVGCGFVSCGNESCPWNYQCCDGNACCPPDANCCHDGHGCCPAGSQCGSIGAVGLYYCIPSWLSGLF